jgi:hypothetical protein
MKSRRLTSAIPGSASSYGPAKDPSHEGSDSSRVPHWVPHGREWEVARCHDDDGRARPDALAADALSIAFLLARACQWVGPSAGPWRRTCCCAFVVPVVFGAVRASRFSACTAGIAVSNWRRWALDCGTSCVWILAEFKLLRGRRRLLDGQGDLAKIRDLSWRELEQLVGEAYRRQGYSVREFGGGGADGGVDLVLQREGQTTLVQCKRWKAWSVGVKVVRELYGVMTAEKASRGVVVSCGRFTRDADRFRRRQADRLGGQ